MSKNRPGDMKCNVRVCVRGRPLNDDERSSGNSLIVKYDGKTVGCKSKSYGPFDEVFDSSISQKDVFDRVVKPQVDRVLAGFNCTVFAYGQTGTGKTYTMEGGRSEAVNSNDDPTTGMTPRAVEMIFMELERNKTEEFTVRVSFVELYNEELYDLLAPVCEDRERLRLYDDPSKKGAVVISGVEEIPVRTRAEVFDLLRRGAERRTTAATLMNRNSSRSHSIFTVTVIVRESNDSGEELVKTGKLNLVDLAGSENIGRSGAEGKRVKEAGNINQSLLTLGRVITSLTSAAPHVPYRESKLTRMLQDSLGGSTITSLIATVSPAACNYEETVSTLEYAMRAKNIKNHPECNQKVSRKALLKEFNAEIEKLRRDLYFARQKTGGIYLSTESYEEMEKNLKLKEEQIDELSEKLEVQFVKLQQFIDDMALIDQEYRNLYKLNSRFRSKLETRVTELDETIKKLTETETKLSAYSGAFKEIHRLAKSLFSELQITREVVVSLENDAEKWWEVEDHLTEINTLNHEATKKTADETSKLVDLVKEKLEDIVEKTNKTVDNLENKITEIGLSSSTDIKVVRANVQAIRHLVEGLNQDCLSTVKGGLENLVQPASTFLDLILKHTDNLMTASRDTSDILLQLTESIQTSRCGIQDNKENMRKDIDAWLGRERSAIVRDEKEREEFREKRQNSDNSFHENSITLINQLMTLVKKKKEDDENLQKEWTSLDTATLDSHKNRVEELPPVVQSFEDEADIQLEQIEKNLQEIQPQIENNRENTKNRCDEMNKEAKKFFEKQRETAKTTATKVEETLEKHIAKTLSNSTLATDACDRVDLAIDDLTQDVRILSKEHADLIVEIKEESSSTASRINSQISTLKRSWEERNHEIESPERSHPELDMTVLIEPPMKVEKLLENHGISREQLPMSKTRESLLDLANVPLSPAAMDRQKKSSKMESISEDDSENTPIV